MRDITINIISDDYEIRRVRKIGNGGGFNQREEYVNKERLVVQLPFDRDFTEINPCNNENYTEGSDFINIRSNQMMFKKVTRAGKAGYLYLLKTFVGSEVLVATVNDNLRVGINAIIDEYWTKKVLISDNKKSRVFHTSLPSKYVGENFTIIPVDDSLIIEKLKDGFKIYSECKYVYTKNAVKQSDKRCQINLPPSFEGKEVIIFKSADIIY